MRIQVLGPLRGWRDGAEVDLGPAGQRAVLGLLVLAGGQPVSVAELIDGLWPEQPPPTAANVLQTHVKRLRQLLELGRRPYSRSEVLPSTGNGYALRLEADDVDLARFRRLVGLADRSRADGDLPGAAEQLDQALRLWQGVPLAGITVLAGHPKVVALVEERQVALAHYAEVMIAAGAAADALPVLIEAAAAQPLDEAAQTRLVRAYHAAGQRAQAFNHYHHTRRRLADELGVDPGPGLIAAHATLLLDASGANASGANASGANGTAATGTAGTGTGVGSRQVPAQLPADVDGFTGRSAELAELSRLLDAARPAGGSPHAAGPTALVISALSGGGGVGKTALAIRWAHQSRGRFPDGQLYVDLRGYDPDQPVTAANALVGFLTALGVASQDIPADLDDRAARFRTEIADRRILVVLDNASSLEQIRRLLPGTPSAAVLVTSRDSLPGLVAVHGAHRLEVELLPTDDAITLLGRLIGPRVDAEPQAAAALAAQCARLPLALRIAAELASSRPAAPLAELVDELGDEQRRLELLDAGGDPRAAVRAVFSWSLQHLPTDAVALFRLIGLHPGADFDAYAAAALAGTTLARVRRTLATLVSAHLVQPAGSGRYGTHDLLRAYATQLAGTHHPDEQLRAARTRLFDYYLAAAAAAMDTWHPAETGSRPRVAPAGTPVPGFNGASRQALAWLDAERGVLGTVCAYTAAHGWTAHAVALAGTLFRYLEAGGHHVDALAIHGHARDAAQLAGDPSGEAVALIHLGTAYWRQGRYEPAAEHLQQALDLARQTGNQAEQARALNSLGIVDWRQGRYEPAAEHLRQALDLARRTDDPAGQARALTNLANVHGSQGQYELAAQRHQQALELARRTGDEIGQARALSNLGHIYVRQGRLDEAAEHHLQALDVFRQAGDRDGEAYVLTGLGDIYGRQGRLDEAAEHHLQALDLFRQAGDRGSEAEPLNGLGETALAAGHRQQALDLHLAALTVATDTGDRYQRARAHDGLGRTHHALGDAAKARAHWRPALTLYTDLAAPEADAVRAGLTALGRRPGPPATTTGSS